MEVNIINPLFFFHVVVMVTTWVKVAFVHQPLCWADVCVTAATAIVNLQALNLLGAESTFRGYTEGHCHWSTEDTSGGANLQLWALIDLCLVTTWVLFTGAKQQQRALVVVPIYNCGHLWLVPSISKALIDLCLASTWALMTGANLLQWHYLWMPSSTRTLIWTGV